MAFERVRLAADLVDVINQPSSFAARGHALRDAFVALRRAEFGGQILLARNAFARNPVIEEIRPVMHFDWMSGELERLFQAAACR